MSASNSNPSASQGVSAGERIQLTDAGGGAPAGGSATWAIVQRELSSLFFSPIAYIIGFIFLFMTGWFFLSETLVSGGEASLRLLFERMAAVLVFALPLLTMRSIADEFASGTIETLMTAPVTDASVILGKFFGALTFFIALLAATLVHALILARYSEPVWSGIMVGYLGLILLGGLFIAVGVFASTCTKHQLLAAIIAMTLLALFTFVVNYGAQYAKDDWVRSLCAYLNILGHYDDFGKGIVDLASVIFFVSGAGFFLFLATKVLESRRWR